jgi:hypothetical protein
VGAAYSLSRLTLDDGTLQDLLRQNLSGHAFAIRSSAGVIFYF